MSSPPSSGRGPPPDGDRLRMPPPPTRQSPRRSSVGPANGKTTPRRNAPPPGGGHTRSATALPSVNVPPASPQSRPPPTSPTRRGQPPPPSGGRPPPPGGARRPPLPSSRGSATLLALPVNGILSKTEASSGALDAARRSRSPPSNKRTPKLSLAKSTSPASRKKRRSFTAGVPPSPPMGALVNFAGSPPTPGRRRPPPPSRSSAGGAAPSSSPRRQQNPSKISQMGPPVTNSINRLTRPPPPSRGGHRRSASMNTLSGNSSANSSAIKSGTTSPLPPQNSTMLPPPIPSDAVNQRLALSAALLLSPGGKRAPPSSDSSVASSVSHDPSQSSRGFSSKIPFTKRLGGNAANTTSNGSTSSGTTGKIGGERGRSKSMAFRLGRLAGGGSGGASSSSSNNSGSNNKSSEQQPTKIGGERGRSRSTAFRLAVNAINASLSASPPRPRRAAPSPPAYLLNGQSSPPSRTPNGLPPPPSRRSNGPPSTLSCLRNGPPSPYSRRLNGPPASPSRRLNGPPSPPSRIRIPRNGPPSPPSRIGAGPRNAPAPAPESPRTARRKSRTLSRQQSPKHKYRGGQLSPKHRSRVVPPPQAHFPAAPTQVVKRHPPRGKSDALLYMQQNGLSPTRRSGPPPCRPVGHPPRGGSDALLLMKRRSFLVRRKSSAALDAARLRAVSQNVDISRPDQSYDGKDENDWTQTFSNKLLHKFSLVNSQAEAGLDTMNRATKFLNKFAKLQKEFAANVARAAEHEIELIQKKENFSNKSTTSLLASSTKGDRMPSSAKANLQFYRHVLQYVEVQSTCAQQVESDLAATLDNCYKRGTESRKATEEQQKEASERMRRCEASLVKSKQKAQKALAQHLGSEREREDSAHDPPKKMNLPDFKGKLQGLQKKSALEACTRYEVDVQQANFIQKTYLSYDMPSCLSDLQALEELRMQTLRRNLERFGTLLRQGSMSLVDKAKEIEQVVAAINPQADLDQFTMDAINQHGAAEVQKPFQYDLKVTVEELMEKQNVSDKNLFGGELSEIMKLPANQGQKVPRIVSALCDAIESSKGFEAEGIFRLSASSDSLSVLRKQLLNNNYSIPKDTSPHTCAALLKEFLRGLKNPLVPECLYEQCIRLGLKAKDDPDYRNKPLRFAEMFSKVPEQNKNIIIYLVNYFNRLTAYEEKNRMGIQNLAIVFAPSFLRDSKTASDPLRLMQNAQYESGFVIYVVEYLSHSKADGIDARPPPIGGVRPQRGLKMGGGLPTPNRRPNGRSSGT